MNKFPNFEIDLKDFYGKKFSSFSFWCQQIEPLVFDDSLSYYEVLCKVSAKLNELIEQVNNLTEAQKEFVDEITNTINDLINQFNQIVTDWNNMVAGWNNMLNQFDQIKIDFQTIKNEFGNIKAEFNDMITTFNSKISEINNKITQIDQTLNNFRNEMNQLKTEVTNNFNNFKQEIENNYNNIINSDLSDIRREIEELKKSVRDGKALLADTLTRLEVPTASDATFAVINQNIETLANNKYQQGFNDGKEEAGAGINFSAVNPNAVYITAAGGERHTNDKLVVNLPANHGYKKLECTTTNGVIELYRDDVKIGNGEWARLNIDLTPYTTGGEFKLQFEARNDVSWGSGLYMYFYKEA